MAIVPGNAGLVTSFIGRGRIAMTMQGIVGAIEDFNAI